MQETSDNSIAEWVAAWGAEVAAVDIRAGRRRFDDDLVAFGTHADVVVGRDAVEAGQWSQIWPAIEDFQFLLEDLRVRLSPDALMAVAIMISTFGCNNGLILSGPRVYWAMARDRLFFEGAGRLHPVYRTPVAGLVFRAIWASVLCVSGTYGQLLDYVIFAALVFYFLTALALFRLHKLRPDLPRPVKAFGYPVLPALYLVSVGALMVILLFEKPLYTWPGLLIVATGIPVYLIWRRGAASA